MSAGSRRYCLHFPMSSGGYRAVALGVVLAAVLAVGIGAALFFASEDDPELEMEDGDGLSVEDPLEWPETSTVGRSVEGRDIELYLFTPERWSDGDPYVLLVGGIHGGYEWNSVLLAYRMIDHFARYPDEMPERVRVGVIPSLNPDGVVAVVGVSGRFNPDEVQLPDDTSVGRFNARGVDLNRNFDCKWQPQSTWRGEVIDAGSEPFSEPEAQALRDVVLQGGPDAVVFWHSQAGAVYGSECHEGVLPITRTVLNAYAEASGYPAVLTFDHYEITGDAEGWLATMGIAGITVEFTRHEDMEWERNLLGTLSVLERLGSPVSGDR